jgi:hypothetical protein
MHSHHYRLNRAIHQLQYQWLEDEVGVWYLRSAALFLILNSSVTNITIVLLRRNFRFLCFIHWTGADVTYLWRLEEIT